MVLYNYSREVEGQTDIYGELGWFVEQKQNKVEPIERVLKVKVDK